MDARPVVAFVIGLSAACVPQEVKQARDLAVAGRLFEACQAFDAALRQNPGDESIEGEAKPIREAFIVQVAKEGSMPSFEEADLATRYAVAADAPKWKTRTLYDKKCTAAAKAGRWQAAVDAALAMEAFGKAATLYREHPEVADAAPKLAELAKAHPNDATVCGEHAFGMGAARQYTAALQEYERCQFIEGGSIERSIYFAAQAAALKKYKEIDEAKAGKGPAKGKTPGSKAQETRP
jgi:tetratricopeptide (TPR) repeat protein